VFFIFKPNLGPQETKFNSRLARALQFQSTELNWLDSRSAGDFYLSFTVYPYANGV